MRTEPTKDFLQGSRSCANRDWLQRSLHIGARNSFKPRDFSETAKKPAIGGLLRLRFGLRGDRAPA